MYKIFFKYCNIVFGRYRSVFINIIILLSLLGAAFISGDAWRSAFLGLGTGAALVNLGESLMELRKQKNEDRVTGEEYNDQYQP